MKETETKNETQINLKKERFHRKINTELKDKYNFNDNNKEINNINTNTYMNPNNRITSRWGRYYLNSGNMNNK